MLRSASEMNAETREAFEDFVMRKLTTATYQKLYSATFSIKDVPNWLQEKLGTFGYELIEDDDLITVAWENIPYAE